MTTRKLLIAIALGVVAGALGIIIAGVPGVWCVIIGEILGWISYPVGYND